MMSEDRVWSFVFIHSGLDFKFFITLISKFLAQDNDFPGL